MSVQQRVAERVEELLAQVPLQADRWVQLVRLVLLVRVC